MSKINIFCFGFGQVAEGFINKLIQEKKDFDLSITSRQETHQIEINNFKVSSFQFSQDKLDRSERGSCYLACRQQEARSVFGVLG